MVQNVSPVSKCYNPLNGVGSAEDAHSDNGSQSSIRTALSTCEKKVPDRSNVDTQALTEHDGVVSKATNRFRVEFLHVENAQSPEDSTKQHTTPSVGLHPATVPIDGDETLWWYGGKCLTGTLQVTYPAYYASDDLTVEIVSTVHHCDEAKTLGGISFHQHGTYRADPRTKGMQITSTPVGQKTSLSDLTPTAVEYFSVTKKRRVLKYVKKTYSHVGIEIPGDLILDHRGNRDEHEIDATEVDGKGGVGWVVDDLDSLYIPDIVGLSVHIFLHRRDYYMEQDTNGCEWNDIHHESMSKQESRCFVPINPFPLPEATIVVAERMQWFPLRLPVSMTFQQHRSFAAPAFLSITLENHSEDPKERRTCSIIRVALDRTETPAVIYDSGSLPGTTTPSVKKVKVQSELGPWIFDDADGMVVEYLHSVSPCDVVLHYLESYTTLMRLRLPTQSLVFGCHPELRTGKHFGMQNKNRACSEVPVSEHDINPIHCTARVEFLMTLPSDQVDPNDATTYWNSESYHHLLPKFLTIQVNFTLVSNPLIPLQYAHIQRSAKNSAPDISSWIEHLEKLYDRDWIGGYGKPCTCAACSNLVIGCVNLGTRTLPEQVKLEDRILS